MSSRRPCPRCSGRRSSARRWSSGSAANACSLRPPRISEPAEGTVLIQLTDRAEVLVEDHAAFDVAREAAKRHLGEDAFYGDGRPRVEEDMGQHHEGDARGAADTIRDLTEYAVESLLEVGSIAPF